MLTGIVGFILGLLGMMISSAGVKRDNPALISLGEGLTWAGTLILIIFFFFRSSR
jgi:hypothetical protein